MNPSSLFSALSAKRMAGLISMARERVIFAAPGIQTEAAAAIAARAKTLRPAACTVSLDFDEHTLRMGFGSLHGVEVLRAAGVVPTHSPGLRCGVFIVDDRGWIFTPTALYLEPEPQSDETPNAVELSPPQVQDLAGRLSPNSANPPELGITPIEAGHFATVKAAIETAPPVKFDVVRQVRVFEPYLQYVELSLTGAALQKHRVQIPKELQNLGVAKDLEGKLKTTFELIEKGGALSSKALEDELNDIRKNFTPSLGKDHGRVVLKAAKPHLARKLAELRAKLDAHQKKVEGELQAKLDESRKLIVAHYLPLAARRTYK